MGNVEQHLSNPDTQLARILAFGREKSKKTWWTLNAVRAGYNVILIDGEGGSKIVRQIPQEYWHKITIVDVEDRSGQPIFGQFVTELFLFKKFIYDIQTRRIVRNSSMLTPEHQYFEVDASKLTHNDILVVDSLTELRFSVILDWARDNGINLADPSEVESDRWGYYRYASTMLDWMLEQMTSLSCHFILIGHETLYEKYSGTGKNRTLESSELIIKSSSNPHAKTVPNRFDDVLYFHIMNRQHRISTEALQGRQGGSRIVQPGDYNWDQFQFENYCEIAQLPKPDDVEQTAFTFFERGNVPQFGSGGLTPSATPKKVDASQPQQGATLSGLMTQK